MSRLLSVIGILIGILGSTLGLVRDGDAAPVAALTAQSDLVFRRLDDPGRTVVLLRSSRVVVATLTDGARTAVLPGPRRTFAEPRFTNATVTSTTQVRLLPQPWKRGAERQPWFRAWLDRAAASSEPDVLAVAMQYIDGQPAMRNAAELRYRGDGAFGPPSHPGASTREEASDFYDYLGVDWDFPVGDNGYPESKRYGAVDCSGFIRLVYGYRMGLPVLNVNRPGPGLPRRAYAIAAFAPGKVIVPNTRERATSYGRLQPGDLVFFDISGSTQIDHAGIYLGRDSAGHHRFVSSRARANGPTLGDLGGTSLLDGGGYYSRAFRTAKRL